MIFNEHDFEKLSQVEKNSLWLLRAIRDRLAEELVTELESQIGDDEDERGHSPQNVMERMVTYNSPNWAEQWYFEHFKKRQSYERVHQVELQQLRALRKVVFRIARLEREALHRKIDRFNDPELLTA